MSWNSYDSIAHLYETASVPKIFVRPAKDLVELAGINASDKVLDVGTGTGATAAAVLDAVGSDARIYGIDVSEEMLKRAKSNGISKLVLGILPDIPFRDVSFDAALSSFVLSHLQEPERLLLEMKRVLKDRGVIGISGWKKAPDPHSELWREIAKTYVDLDLLDAKSQEAIPHEQTFSSTSNMSEMLEAVGFSDIGVEERTFDVETTLDNFLKMRESAMGSRMIRVTISKSDWDSFQAELHQKFSEEFDEPLCYQRTANLAVGTK